ncbi:MAG: hypothetical protein ACK53L_33285 [Pirellulaceae bacterium]
MAGSRRGDLTFIARSPSSDAAAAGTGDGRGVPTFEYLLVFAVFAGAMVVCCLIACLATSRARRSLPR